MEYRPLIPSNDGGHFRNCRLNCQRSFALVRFALALALAEEYTDDESSF
jgi:hypothetical protein